MIKLQELTAYADDDKSEKVIWNDSRKRVTPYEYPFSAIGCLESTWNEGKCTFSSSSTAFIISKHAILTAAFNVVNQKDEIANSIFFYPGLNRDMGRRYKVIDVKPLRKSSLPKFASSQLAVLFVKENIQSIHGSLGLLDIEKDSELFEIREFILSGYPADLFKKG